MLQDGLYRYDAIARLQDASLRRRPHDPLPEIGKYLRLGPLGTALAVPKEAKQRVLLVDEIDKSDIDLPNDLLHVLEEGEFSIPEIQRLPPDEAARAQVAPDDEGAPVSIPGGRIHCGTFPIVIFTSNGERDFPPAFLRRCLRLDLAQPTFERLEEIVAAHFKLEVISPEARDLIEQFVSERNAGKQLAIDQLLNAVFLVTKVQLSPEELHTVRDDLILRPLSGS
jgi:MoxR-like ATPase